MARLKNAINWFEIPAINIERAVKFYSKVLDVEMPMSTSAPATKMAFFPADPDGVQGALVQAEGYVPSDKGSLLYLNAGDDLAPALARVKPAGGSVIREKFSIGEHGFIAYFKDTEGNKIAFHSMK
jgi:predicted enzyme related to lactoylglutathione lyase